MIELRETTEADLPALSELFERGFGHGITMDEWAWKYRSTPGRSRSMVARGEDGRVFAHVGALGFEAEWEGRRALLWQAVDWVGRPGSGLRPPLVRLGRRLLGEVPGPGDVPWIFGFPSERHQGLGRRVLGYRAVVDIRPWVGPLPEPGLGGAMAATVTDSCSEWAESVWRECGVSGIRRTASWLNWRYHARPGRYYRFYHLVAGDAEGLVVAAFVEREAWLAEVWLPPPLEPVAALGPVAADLRAAGLERWRAWPLPGGGTEALETLGLAPLAAGLTLSCRSRAGAPECCEPAARVYHAMGDYDAV